MPKLLLGVIALIGLVSPALAADWNWTGCYVGGGIGGVWGSSEKWVVKTPGAPFSGESLGRHDVNGWIGGVQGGCDYQLDNVVLGIQGDYGWTGADGRHPSAQEIGSVFAHRSDGLRLEPLSGLRQGRHCLGARRLRRFNHPGHDRDRRFNGA